ncbi:MAG: PD-(D/E)XK nuclease family protein, partial [Candidatus Binataceae bacterium]
MSSDEANEIVVSPLAAHRLAAARTWLERITPGAEALLVAPSQEAADDLGRAIALERGASFALHRLTFNRLSGLLAADYAAANGLVYVSGLGAQAVAARALFALAGDPRLAPLAAVVHLPGLPKAIAATYAELSHAMVEPQAVAELTETGGALAAIFDQFEVQLRAGRLIDRAGILKAAIAALAGGSLPRFAGLPTLLLDVPMASRLECGFLAALAARAPSLLATIPAGDSRSLGYLANALAVAPRHLTAAEGGDALARVQEFLFAEATPPPAALDASVTLGSAAGEMQECVEIARRIQAEARRGARFDQIAVLLHTPARYAPYLEEALTRAEIPAWFARGAKRPEPGGRALLALLN